MIPHFAYINYQESLQQVPNQATRKDTVNNPESNQSDNNLTQTKRKDLERARISLYSHPTSQAAASTPTVIAKAEKKPQ